ncbi:25109_t:CDS:2 [Dentiscutata erythropus]|uniref:25109_t:CDS:1 n=1 Tax=Dentiscutata erythropus TaxID=1348616 RepID=A0A9N9CEM0_9GLOM|nr:25109_t:CDS:2 [Dentiscutata erythropus]
MFSLFENIKDKVIAAKQHLKKEVRKTKEERLISSPQQKTPVLPLQKEPTITEVQEELPKENIPVPNLEENPKENAENLANLDTMMNIQKRVITADILYKKHLLKITNVYAPPNMKDRTAFFENWIPPFDKDKINIIAGDFNTNLDPTINRISQANIQNDLSRLKLKRLLNNLLDSASLLEKKPFLTFYQNTRNNQSMATRLNYIFIDKNYQKTETLYGNSDHL